MMLTNKHFALKIKDFNILIEMEFGVPNKSNFTALTNINFIDPKGFHIRPFGFGDSEKECLLDLCSQLQILFDLKTSKLYIYNLIKENTTLVNEIYLGNKLRPNKHLYFSESGDVIDVFNQDGKKQIQNKFSSDTEKYEVLLSLATNEKIKYDLKNIFKEENTDIPCSLNAFMKVETRTYAVNDKKDR